MQIFFQFSNIMFESIILVAIVTAKNIEISVGTYTNRVDSVPKNRLDFLIK